MIITFSGLNGAGKTVTSKLLADRLGWQWHGAGMFMRQLAKKKGMTISEFDAFVKQNPDIDKELDQQISLLADKNESLVVDGRLAWYFLPSSIKIFLTASEDVRVKRVFAVGREREVYSSYEESKHLLQKRIDITRNRWMQLYGINGYDENNFDIVIDTSNHTPEDTVNEILSRIQDQL